MKGNKEKVRIEYKIVNKKIKFKLIIKNDAIVKLISFK